MIHNDEHVHCTVHQKKINHNNIHFEMSQSQPLTGHINCHTPILLMIPKQYIYARHVSVKDNYTIVIFSHLHAHLALHHRKNRVPDKNFNSAKTIP